MWRSHKGSDNGDRCYTFSTTRGALVAQPEVPLTLRRAKSIIPTHIDKCTAVTPKTKSLGKPWETLATVGYIPGPGTRNSRRAASPLVRLAESEERWEASDTPRVFSLKIGWSRVKKYCYLYDIQSYG
ncbi:hypothetical protein TNCV_2394171 [Trichonephila clavipes]|nr:hypothetical protein TNCV_2394171 [Trichonephila clavipes]